MQRSTIRKISLGVAVVAAFGWCVYAALIIGMATGGVMFAPPIDVIVLSVLGLLVGIYGVVDRLLKEHPKANDQTQALPILRPRDRYSNPGTTYQSVPQQRPAEHRSSRRRSSEPDVVRFRTMEERMSDRMDGFMAGKWPDHEEPPSGDLAPPGISK